VHSSGLRRGNPGLQAGVKGVSATPGNAHQGRNRGNSPPPKVKIRYRQRCHTRGYVHQGRARHVPGHMRHIPATGIVVVFAAGLTLTACGQAATTTAPSPAPASASAIKAKAARAAAAVNAKATACSNRPHAGDIYVRQVIPGEPPAAQALGGGFVWDYSTSTCDSTTQLSMQTALGDPGTCTQVASVASNPGYDPDAAPPLRGVVAEAGPAC